MFVTLLATSIYAISDAGLDLYLDHESNGTPTSDLLESFVYDFQSTTPEYILYQEGILEGLSVLAPLKKEGFSEDLEKLKQLFRAYVQADRMDVAKEIIRHSFAMTNKSYDSDEVVDQAQLLLQFIENKYLDYSKDKYKVWKLIGLVDVLDYYIPELESDEEDIRLIHAYDDLDYAIKSLCEAKTRKEAKEQLREIPKWIKTLRNLLENASM